MKTNNKMSKLVYLSLVFFINLLSVILFFRFLYNETLFKFEGLFSIIYIVCIVLGLVITYRRHRTIKSAVCVVIIPFGIYCFVAYHSFWTTISSIALLASLMFLFTRIFHKPISRNKDKNLINIIRFKKMIRASFSMLGFYSSILVITTIIASLFSGSALAKNMDDNNLEKKNILSFSLDDWQAATDDRKLSYAREIVDYEIEKLNIKPLTLSVSSKMPDTKLAYYSDNQSKIVINKNHLSNDSILNVLNSLTHECFHCAQYSLIKNEEYYSGNTSIERDIAEKIEKYKVEIKDYKEYKDSDSKFDYIKYMEYYTQKLEIDARSYGDSESVVIFKLIISNN